MSLASIIVLATTPSAEPPAAVANVAPTPPIDQYALSLGIPSTDGWTGAQLTFERWFREQRIAIGIAGELRESAAGDYTGIRLGAAVQIRRFGQEKPYLSTLPRGSMAGWFVGAAVHLDGNFMHDDVDSRWLATTLQFGLSGEVGYRIAPWRKLIITPTCGVEWHHDIDVSGRLPGWSKVGFIAGLEIGWLF